jgi:hypothetical protein
MSNQYGPRIVTDGLVLCLDAANRTSYPGSGTVWYDLSGNSNNGNLVNFSFDNSNNGSIIFNGTSTSCVLSSSLDLRTLVCPLTIVAWAYQNTLGNRTIFAQYARTSNFGLTKLIRIDNSIMYYYHGLNTGSFSQAAITGIELNRWNYFSVTVSGSPSSAYIQLGCNLRYGSPNFRNNLTTTPDTSVPISIGTNAGFTEDWNGRISNVAVYNKALSQAELLQNYNALKGRYGL